MIVANLATYPPRESNLAAVVEAILPQVDRLNIVLNQYDGVLPAFSGDEKIAQIIPGEDQKDVGKFYPDVSGATWVFMIDDDMIYPADFVATSIAAMERLEATGGKFLGGYHGSLYYEPQFSLAPGALLKYLRYKPVNIAAYRKPFRFYQALEKPTVVDQIATNAALMRGEHFPPHSFMAGSQKFVDVRLARWCIENGITPTCLPRAAGWLGEVRFEETIFRGFTRQNPPHVSEEIWTYALKVPGRGEPVGEGS